MNPTPHLHHPVIIESPFAGRGDRHSIRERDREDNIEYARTAMRDSILRGEAPFASHLLYTQDGILDDSIEAERKIGIACGAMWRQRALKTIFYTDREWSPGMIEALRYVLLHSMSFKLRSLHRTPQLPDGIWPVSVMRSLDTSPPSPFLFRNTTS